MTRSSNEGSRNIIDRNRPIQGSPQIRTTEGTMRRGGAPLISQQSSSSIDNRHKAKNITMQPINLQGAGAMRTIATQAWNADTQWQ